MISIYGPFRALSFSVLYPQLHRMLDAGLIQEQISEGTGRRSRIVYLITAKGQERFAAIASKSEPDSWEDESFEVRFAFFGPTPARNRLAILEGRHRKLADKASILHSELEKSPEGLDKYLVEWRRHSLESAEREIAWLEEMINTERKSSRE
jgi:DNA-binding PadR family transcriptional regulator